MKKTVTFLLALLMTVTNTKGQGVFIIRGNFSGNVEGRTVYLLSGSSAMAGREVDSTVITNGKFEFKGNTKQPEEFMIKLFLSEDRSLFTSTDYKHIPRPVIPLLIDTGTINIIATLTDIPLSSKNGGYDLSKVQISGSTVTEANVDYSTGLSKGIAQKEKAQGVYKEYLAKRPNAPLPEGLAAIKNLDEIDSLSKIFIVSFIKKNSNNLAAVYALRDNLSSNIGIFSPNEIDDLLSSFSTSVKATNYYKAVAKEAVATKKSAIGAQFLDLSLKDVNGKVSKLSDFVGKGRYVLVDFWGPWCIPCRKEFPHVKERYALYHPVGFEIIGISIDSHKDRWPKAMNEEQLPWPQFALETTIEVSKRLYNYGSIPFCVLIDPQGKIVDRNMLGTYLDRKLIEIFGDKISNH